MCCAIEEKRDMLKLDYKFYKNKNSTKREKMYLELCQERRQPHIIFKKLDEK